MSRRLCEIPASCHKVTQCPLMFLLLGKHVVVRVIMLCFKRQLWFQNKNWVWGRWRVGGWGRGFPVMTGVRHWTLTVMDTTDVLQFLILDLHKSEVGPSILIFFFFKNQNSYSKITKNQIWFQQAFLPLYTRVNNCAAINVTVSPVSRFSHECKTLGQHPYLSIIHRCISLSLASCNSLGSLL